jgi:protein phosphatase
LFLDPELGLFSVADGMGGHRGGEVASRLASETLAQFIKATSSGTEMTWPFPFDPRQSPGANRLSAGMRLSNRRVFDAGRTDPQLAGMGTTLVAVLVSRSHLVIGHVGDSRAYRLRANRLEQLTIDHTWVAAVLGAGGETRKEDHPMRHVLTNGIGMREDVIPVITELSQEAGDTWLLCSDGVHGFLNDDAIAEALSAATPDAAADRIVRGAVNGGGTDNATAVVLRFV